ncbi:MULTISPECIES: flagella synthesis protein FlgN [unclassified Vibrio]|uniref:flagella synthesis protein FlgN n=1 Tax=unclassified Vibrio TaxID=2614977 RepID=UPI00137376AE|nr:MULTISPECIES: flagellar export chaperone FlgN [unclassified Vibrio]NAW68522.1 flagellar protein FlgN [Vibrio sp. V28_P6S34P95]NAX06547.1 flagellar protein FlgN [Vibrio sp. V30_P3S12P165]NAX33615.1 flagellar protein FlgN [Vibrio sp. V29_P1S30P107]NAX37940.1 flagellar protein FlgN [Vibrio sp. V27_P1S3P104]NAX39801.1 flagellar protein FlgN [Vibrio sp. V26_P1S5P106]
MATLKDLVEFQLKNAEQLSALLDQEKIAITSRVSSDIEAVAKQKITLVNQLKQTDQRISRHPDVKSLTEDDDLHGVMNHIRSIIHDCQQSNNINGEALARAQLSFNKLNNLMQQSHGKIGMTYNATGQTHTISTLGTNLKA